jgi:hypothetical protein
LVVWLVDWLEKDDLVDWLAKDDLVVVQAEIPNSSQ